MSDSPTIKHRKQAGSSIDTQQGDKKQPKRSNQQKKAPLVVRVLPLIALLTLGLFALALVSKFVTNSYTFGLFDATRQTPAGNVQTDSPRKLKLFTETELARYDGSDERLPILLSIKGRVYDVTAGKQFYQKGASYNFFAGKDATRSFLTGCFNDECFKKQPRGLVGLNEKEIKEVDDWVKTYDEKYILVGFLKGYHEEFNYPEAAQFRAKQTKG